MNLKDGIGQDLEHNISYFHSNLYEREVNDTFIKHNRMLYGSRVNKEHIIMLLLLWASP